MRYKVPLRMTLVTTLVQETRNILQNVQKTTVCNTILNEYLKVLCIYYKKSWQHSFFFNITHNFFKNSFFPTIILEWNILDPNLWKSKCPSSFKDSILRFIKPSPNSFLIVIIMKVLDLIYDTIVRRSEQESFAWAQIQAKFSKLFVLLWFKPILTH